MSVSKFSTEELDAAISRLPSNGGLSQVENPQNRTFTNEIYWHLKSAGYVFTEESTEDVLYARLTDKGLLLVNTGGFKSLHKKDDRENKIKELQLNELEFQKRIRKQIPE